MTVFSQGLGIEALTEESHLAAQTEDNIRAGMSQEEARREARLKFGSVETIREGYHAEEGLPFLEHLIQECALCAPATPKIARFHAGAGHRRNHGDLHARAAGNVAIAAGQQTRTALAHRR